MYVSSRQPDRVRYGNSLRTWDHAIRRGTIAAMKKNSNKLRPANAKSTENRLAEASTADDGLREPNLTRALDLVMELMAIAGRSGEEQQIASAICHHLRNAGLPASAITHDSAHRRTRLPGEVGNLIVKLPGTRRAPRRLLSAHLDTVPVCVGSEPSRKGGYVQSRNSTTGLGADNRAGSTVLLATALELLEHGYPHPPLTFCWFVQEEIGLEGSRHVTKRMLGRPAYAFNWDGGSPYKLTVGATGGYRLEIEVRGIASHAGGAPEKGVSAIAIASLAIADLHRGGWHGAIQKDSDTGTSNVGVIQGGDATNVVTDRVRIRAEARSHHSIFRERIVEEIRHAFHRAVQEVSNAEGKRGSVHFSGRLDYESFLLEESNPSVLAAEAAIRKVGEEPLRAVSNGGVDANWLTRHGIPTVTLGCGQLYPHTTSESLDIRQFEDACRIGLRLATGEVP
jgi:tripeptide aminopeptidase